MQAGMKILTVIIGMSLCLTAQARPVDHVGTLQEADKYGVQNYAKSDTAYKGEVIAAKRTKAPIAPRPSRPPPMCGRWGW